MYQNNVWIQSFKNFKFKKNYNSQNIILKATNVLDVVNNCCAIMVVDEGFRTPKFSISFTLLMGKIFFQKKRVIIFSVVNLEKAITSSSCLNTMIKITTFPISVFHIFSNHSSFVKSWVVVQKFEKLTKTFYDVISKKQGLPFNGDFKL